MRFLRMMTALLIGSVGLLALAPESQACDRCLFGRRAYYQPVYAYYPPAPLYYPPVVAYTPPVTVYYRTVSTYYQPVTYLPATNYLRPISAFYQPFTAYYPPVVAYYGPMATYYPPAPAYSTPAGPATTISIGAADNFFEPGTLNVQSGTTVNWVNNGRHTHTITSQDGQWSSGDLAPGATFRMKFVTPGTYDYYCRHHTGMQGTIVVGGSPGSIPDIYAKASH